MPSLAASYVRRLQSVRQNLRANLIGSMDRWETLRFLDGGKVAVFGKFLKLGGVIFDETLQLTKFKDFFQVRYHEDVPILYFAKEVPK